MCHGPVFDLSNAAFLQLVRTSRNTREIAQKLGIKSLKGIITRLKTLSETDQKNFETQSENKIQSKIKIKLKNSSEFESK